MILREAHLTYYKCIKDSTPISIDKDVTCLVGKNEAGKTAILEALHKLKPVGDADGKFDVTKEYFRPLVLEYQPRHASNPDVAVQTTWEPEEDDFKVLEALVGPTARKLGPVKVAKRFNDTLQVDFALNEAEVIQDILKSSDLEASEQEKHQTASTVKDLVSQLVATQEDQQKRNALAQAIKKRFGDNKTAREATTELIDRKSVV